eukprot:5344799-Pyramimonas_sp.AAC.1
MAAQLGIQQTPRPLKIRQSAPIARPCPARAVTANAGTIMNCALHAQRWTPPMLTQKPPAPFRWEDWIQPRPPARQAPVLRTK